MRLKEIKPGMVVHCDTEEKAKQLISWAYKNGFHWISNNAETTLFEPYRSSTCYKFNEDMEISYQNISYFTIEDEDIIEFSDLILPELTAEEAIKLHGEACNGICSDCPLYEVDGYDSCDDLCFSNPKKAVEILAKWKADNEKKEPETEWVYRVFGAENFGKKFFNTEEEAIARCEELVKSQKNRQYARYEKVCRVKE